jgi:hypothetical protein
MHVSDFELHSTDAAKRLIEGECSKFGDRLKLFRTDRPDLQPLSSGMRIFSWLLLLREEWDEVGADACELHWLVRSGFNLLPFQYDIPTSDLDNYPSATEPDAQSHNEIMRTKEAGYLDTWDVIRRESDCDAATPYGCHRTT